MFSFFRPLGKSVFLIWQRVGKRALAFPITKTINAEGPLKLTSTHSIKKMLIITNTNKLHAN